MNQNTGTQKGFDEDNKSKPNQQSQPYATKSDDSNESGSKGGRSDQSAVNNNADKSQNQK